MDKPSEPTHVPAEPIHVLHRHSLDEDPRRRRIHLLEEVDHS